MEIVKGEIMRKRLDSNKIKWSDYFTYSEDSPSGLKWLNGTNCRNINFRSSPGDTVGTKVYYKSGKPKSYQVCMCRHTYLVHRIIWCLVYGSIENELAIDHIDGNGFNNNIKNLRLVNVELNARNASLRSDSKTETNGVYRSSNEESVQKGKYFSIDNLGETQAFNLAKLFRESKILELNSKGAGYTDRHGT
jgi:hypothetical protein